MAMNRAAGGQAESPVCGIQEYWLRILAPRVRAWSVGSSTSMVLASSLSLAKEAWVAHHLSSETRWLGRLPHEPSSPDSFLCLKPASSSLPADKWWWIIDEDTLTHSTLLRQRGGASCYLREALGHLEDKVTSQVGK